jgi:Outer membrane protein beta-barrel domain
MILVKHKSYNMKRLTFIVFFSILFVFSLKSNAEDFTQKEKAIIYTKSIQVLESYQNLINQIGNQSIDDARSSLEDLMELFINRKILIFNDLDPSHKLSEFYEAETYASNLILWYPDGMNVELLVDNAKVSTINQHDENIYSIDVMTNKNIDGNYLNKTINENTEEITFRIAFSFNNNKLENFKIAGIRNAKSTTKIDDAKTLKEVASEELSEEELEKAHASLRGVLNDYNNFLALLGDPEEFEEDKEFYKQSFTNLFKNPQVTIFNDLEEKPEKTFLNIEDYLKSYAELYPEGIKNIALNVDSAEFGSISKNDIGGYYSYVYADKFFSGNLRQKELYRNQNNLMFKVNFSKTGNTYSDFNIESIDQTSFEYYNASESGNEMPTLDINPVSRKGLSISADASFAITSITDETLTSFTLEQDFQEWSYEKDPGFSVGIGVNYFFTDNIGISSGIQLSNYSSKYSLSGQFQSEESQIIQNNTPFYKVIDAEYDSVLNLSYIGIPIMGSYRMGKPGKLGLYVDAGVIISFTASKSYEITGNYEYAGYFPDGLILGPFYTEDDNTIIRVDTYNEEPDKQAFIDAYGFYKKEDINESGDIEVKSTKLSMYTSFGVSLPLGFYSSLQFGPEILFGVSDISDSSPYIDIYGSEISRKQMKLQKYGFKISYVYKL